MKLNNDTKTVAIETVDIEVSVEAISAMALVKTEEPKLPVDDNTTTDK